MPTRSSVIRLIAPLAVTIAVSMLVCAAAFKVVWPDVKLIVILLPTAVASALTVAWLLIVLRRRWVGPVRHLADVADQMTLGDWSARAEIGGAEDARSLAGRLNLLAATAQKQMADIDHQRSDLQQLVDSLPDPILLTDAQHRVTLINTPAARLLQVAPVQALGKKLYHVVNEVQVLELFEALTRPPAPGGAPPSPSAVQQREVRINRAGQRSFYQGVGTRTRAGGVLIVLRNVTTMASAVQMKTDFVANASHELRTPIAAIKIAFETLNEVFDEDREQARRCSAIIAGHLNRLEEMLRDLLDLSRVENAELKPVLTRVRAGRVLADVGTALGSMARQKGVELGFEDAEELYLGSDPRLLDLILKNLVENSIKYTPEGGRVTVAVRRGVVPAPGVGATAVEAEGSATGLTGPAVAWTVTDTGIGIPPEHLERVFERFYQVNASRTGGVSRGTGLGLAIVKHAVHALGGSVYLESAVGAGTTATVIVPDQAATDAGPGEAPAEASEAAVSPQA